MAHVDYFLKLDGVDGESLDDKHKAEIEIESWSFGATQMGTSSAGGGAGAGKVAMNDFHFVMKVNKASPKLLLLTCTGEPIKKGILTARKAGKEQQEYYKLTFSDLIVSSFQTGGSGGGSPVPTEQISINFAKIEMEYKEQKPDGTLAGPVKMAFDLKKMKAG